jgi:hypothetical protein
MTAKIILEGLKATEMNTNFIGSLHGVAKYYNYHYTQQWLMAGTGMAFFINIHDELCPSAPYVIDYLPITQLAENLGLQFEEIGFTQGDLSQALHLDMMEVKMRGFLDNKIPLIIQNMDNQIIYGLDEEGFLLHPHYPNYVTDFPPKLTFKTWKEFGTEIHSMVWAVKKIAPVSPKKVIKDALTFALKAIEGEYSANPPSTDNYKSGLHGYNTWIEYLNKNDGNNHGHWWNSSVWSECRTHAHLFFRDLSYIEENHDVKISQALAATYQEIALALKQGREKTLPQQEKLSFITKARDLEKEVRSNIAALLGNFKSP